LVVNIEAVRKHISVSDIRMKDAGLPGASTYARFDAAYDAILCCGLAILELSRKEITSDKGHHLAILEFLVEALQFRGQNASDIKAMSRARNANRYGSGPAATEKMVEEAIALAERVRAEVEIWITKRQSNAPKP
jgi:hypothetical protein